MGHSLSQAPCQTPPIRVCSPPPLSLSIPLGNYSANSANLREMQIEGGRVKGPAQCYTLGGVTEPGAEA